MYEGGIRGPEWKVRKRRMWEDGSAPWYVYEKYTVEMLGTWSRVTSGDVAHPDEDNLIFKKQI